MVHGDIEYFRESLFTSIGIFELLKIHDYRVLSQIILWQS